MFNNYFPYLFSETFYSYFCGSPFILHLFRFASVFNFGFSFAFVYFSKSLFVAFGALSWQIQKIDFTYWLMRGEFIFEVSQPVSYRPAVEFRSCRIHSPSQLCYLVVDVVKSAACRVLRQVEPFPSIRVSYMPIIHMYLRSTCRVVLVRYTNTYLMIFQIFLVEY